MRSFVLLLAVLSLAAGCSAPPPQEAAPPLPPTKLEVVDLPDTDVSFEMAFIPRTPPSPNSRSLEGFWIGRTEVTWKEFHPFRFVDRRDWRAKRDGKIDAIARPTDSLVFIQSFWKWKPDTARGARPVTNVNWHIALSYCDWLTMKTGRKFRPPTEAEWERACRGPVDGPGSSDHFDRGWVKENSKEAPHPVGKRTPNGFGLFDMLGNVEETCLEPFSPGGINVALRGGSWSHPAEKVGPDARRSVQAEWSDPDPNRPWSIWWHIGGHTQGMRVVRVERAVIGSALEEISDRLPIRLRLLGERQLKVHRVTRWMVEVEGEIANKTDRTLSEVEVAIYYLTPKGTPHRVDVDGSMGTYGRPTFTRAWPVLTQGFHPGPARKPLGPGESRTFRAFVPQSFDEDGVGVALNRLEAKVTSLVFSR